MQKITPCLWFDFNADEALELYKGIFKDNLKVGDTLYYENPHPQSEAQKGDILTIEYQIFGQDFVALNGGPQFPHTNAVSFMIPCKDQAEIDYYWNAILKSGGQEDQCGWIRDKFGVAWQIFPERLMDMHKDKNPAKRKAAMDAMMKMVKIDLSELERVYNAA